MARPCSRFLHLKTWVSGTWSQQQLFGRERQHSRRSARRMREFLSLDFSLQGGVGCAMILFHLLRNVPMTALYAKEERRILLPIGFWAGISSLAQYLALTMIHPATFIALKRTANSFNL